VKYCGSRIIKTFGSQMAVRLFALRAGRALLLRNSSISVSGMHLCYRLSKPQEIENSLTWRLEPATFRLVE
jgi:hypothetical protein